MDILVIFFLFGSLMLSLAFLYSSARHLQMAQAGRRMGEHQAADYLKRRAILGGAMALNRLFWAFIILLPRLGWIDTSTAVFRDIVFAVWVLNEVIGWWAWRKTI